MKDRWFVYPEDSLSTDAVRAGGGDQEAHPEKVLNKNRHLKEFEVFEVPFAVAKWLRNSVRGGQQWNLRFFRLIDGRIYPVEADPTSSKSPKVEALKRAVKARIKREGVKN